MNRNNRKRIIICSFILIIITVVYLSISHFITSQPTVNQANVKSAVLNGQLFLGKLQQQNGAIYDTLNPLFSIWETVLAAKALYFVKHDSNEAAFANALKFLKANENKEGLVCHNLKCKDNYCIETTSIYLQLLIDVQGRETVNSRINIVKGMQQKTGEWFIGNPDVKENLDFPSATAFALNLLQKAQVQPLYQKESLQWLMKKQNKEGHWGQTWEFYGLPAYALYTISEVIMNTTNESMKNVRTKAINYILNSQQPDGSWAFYGDPFGIKKPSRELETALMLSALQNFQYRSKEKSEQLETAALKAILFLLSTQNKNGGWDGGFFPIDSRQYVKKEYVFATALSIIALQNFINHQLVSK